MRNPSDMPEPAADEAEAPPAEGSCSPVAPVDDSNCAHCPQNAILDQRSFGDINGNVNPERRTAVAGFVQC